MAHKFPIFDDLPAGEKSLTSGHKSNSRNSLRQKAFCLTLAFVFVRCSQLHELVTYQFHFNSYLLFILGVPALLCLVISDDLRRPFRLPPGYCWLGFSLWIVVTVPFSFWRGGALPLVEDYWRTNVIIFVLLGGLLRKWNEFEWLLRAMAIACVFNLVIIKVYARLDESGRMHLPFGALANSNDYAAHLLLLLPSLLWVALVAKSLTTRIVVLATVAYGLFAVLASASRGALVATVAGAIYFVCLSSKKQRIWTAGILVVIGVGVFSLESQEVVQRMLSFSKNSGSSSEEAIESSDMRQMLLRDAILLAIKHPLFGVGPRSFTTVEEKGRPASMWHEAHNSYAEVASECGFPGFLFFAGGLTSSFLVFWHIARRYRKTVRAMRVYNAALCMQLMMVMFCLAAGFLNFAYSFHFPLIVGTSLAMAEAERSERRRALNRGIHQAQHGSAFVNTENATSK